MGPQPPVPWHGGLASPCWITDGCACLLYGEFRKIKTKLQKTLVLHIGVRYIIYKKIGGKAGILSNPAVLFCLPRKTEENQWEELMESKNRSTAAAAPELPGRRAPVRPWRRENACAGPTAGTGRYAALAAWRIYGRECRDTYTGDGSAPVSCRCPQEVLLRGTARRDGVPRLRGRGIARLAAGCLKKTKTEDRGR